MELTLFQIGKPAIFLQKIWHLPYGFHMTPSLIFSVDENIIQTYNNKDIKLFYQDLIDISLEAGQSIQ